MGNEQPAMTTDGRRHFSLFKQVDQLVSASESEAELAFMHRMMALCSLPRTNPGNANQFTRASTGRLQTSSCLLDCAQQAALRQHSPAADGLDVFTEATQKQSRELFLGNSLSGFLGKVGIPKGGGRSNPAPRSNGPALQCLMSR